MSIWGDFLLRFGVKIWGKSWGFFFFWMSIDWFYKSITIKSNCSNISSGINILLRIGFFCRILSEQKIDEKLVSRGLSSQLG
jgi:hypothetical protein